MSLLESSGSDLFAFTESGLNEAIPDAEFILPGYQVLRCDRADGRKQGGVLLVATPRIELRQVSMSGDIDIDCHNFELVCATVYNGNRFLFALCIVYIPPQADENEYMLLFSILEKMCVKYKANLCICIHKFAVDVYHPALAVCVERRAPLAPVSFTPSEPLLNMRKFYSFN